MAYITAALLEERIGSTLYGQLINQSDSQKATTLINNIINRACGRLDMYLANRYTVPLQTVTGAIEDYTLTFAEYELYSRTDWPDIPEKLQKKYDNMLKELDKIASGELSIPIAAEEEKGTAIFNIESDTLIYSSDNMLGY